MSCCRQRFVESVADRLASAGLTREASALRTVEAADAWKNLPKGWTEKSLRSMWGKLTGDRKHKITACAKKMKGHVTDEYAFCASLARRMGYNPNR